MYREDIQGSIAHATMLVKCGIISESDSEQIIAGLEQIREDIDKGVFQFDPNAEDIHMFIESELTNRVGEAGKKLHTARSRNDQVATDLRLYLKRENDEIHRLLTVLNSTLRLIAEKHTKTIMPGYTHLQRAQPITFSNHLLAYEEMFCRDLIQEKSY
jgi:argininosuccinate lyase